MAGDRELKAMETTLGALQALDPEERQRVLDWLAAKLGLEAPAPSDFASSGGAVGDGGNLGTIKQFLNQKRPEDDVVRATTLAYFLTRGKDQATFKTADLTKARVDAALANFNMSRAVSNAQRAGYLTTAGKRGTFQVTGTGEALVAALPDAGAVKKVKEQGRRRRRKSTATKRATTKGAARKR
jgi:hypothetical protein